MFQLTDLPDTLFLEILSFLTPREIVLHRLVSHASHAALTRPDLSQALLHVFFPRSLECRLLRSRASSERRQQPHSSQEHERPGRGPAPTEAAEAEAEPDWPALFAYVARRYHNLSRATFHSLTRITILKPSAPLRRFESWARQLCVDVHLAPLKLPDPNWTYADGVLIYPSPSSSHSSASRRPYSRALSPESSPSSTSPSSISIPSLDPPVLKALDLNSGDESIVPFDWTDKVVRRVRLAGGILIVEWVEARGFHPLNEGEVAHRHFATAFDVRAASSPLHPLRRSDNKPQTNQDASRNSAVTDEGEDDEVTCNKAPVATFRSEWKIHYLGLPILAQDRIFSTHNATHYALFAHQPTRSPWGEDTPLERLVVWSLNGPSPYRPSLDPSSSNKPLSDPGPDVVLHLTNGELDHWGVRQLNTPRLMRLALDTVEDDSEEAKRVSGHVFIQEEDHLWSSGPHASENPPARHTVRSVGIPLSGTGPRWAHECGADGDAERSFCPAARSRPWSTAETTWPGKAPCWRHEEFPYLTVAESVDAGAGVRVCGRRCFTMETVSACVDGDHGRDDQGRRETPGTTNAAGAVSAATPDAGAETAVRGEVQFEDDMWKTLMKGAALAGDERWVIGEDAAGDVSVVRF
ncbi:f-box domain-containing protein [Colletotrichum incanum]|uniref:F-box domain-containing protein n=1 Tax=Colletotrichum incanum TaxID=1573173 RepID=A0A167C912_COLIC|nr:f-box domain-containing protein [Colletotrichum incanum]